MGKPIQLHNLLASRGSSHALKEANCPFKALSTHRTGARCFATSLALPRRRPRGVNCSLARSKGFSDQRCRQSKKSSRSQLSELNTVSSESALRHCHFAEVAQSPKSSSELLRDISS